MGKRILRLKVTLSRRLAGSNTLIDTLIYDYSAKRGDFKMEVLDRMQKLKDVITSYTGSEGALLPVLQEAQKIYGYLPREAETLIADGLGVPLVKVISVRSFYAYFYGEKVGRYIIRVCKSSSCHINQSAATLQAFENSLNIKSGDTTSDGKFSLETCGCLGVCEMSPAVMINDQIFGPVYAENVESLLAQFE